MEDLVKIVLGILFIIGAIIFTVWFLVNYGNVPVGELPTWLWWMVN